MRWLFTKCVTLLHNVALLQDGVIFLLHFEHLLHNGNLLHNAAQHTFIKGVKHISPISLMACVNWTAAHLQFLVIHKTVSSTTHQVSQRYVHPHIQYL